MISQNVVSILVCCLPGGKETDLGTREERKADGIQYMVVEGPFC